MNKDGYEANELLDHGTRSRAETKASVVENVHGDLEALADLAEDVLDGHLGVFKEDLNGVGALDTKLALRLAGADAAKRLIDDERGHLLLTVDLGLGKDGVDLGPATVGDENLASVQEEAGESEGLALQTSKRGRACILLAVGGEGRLGANGRGIRAGCGLGQGERGNVFAGGQLGEVLFLLEIVTVEEDALETN